MSRFSRAEAEARGWQIVHERDEYTTIESETQGRTQYTPPTIRAEKSLSGGGMINEEAESMGKLLERIHAYEQHQESKGIKQTATPINEAAVPRNEAGLPIRTVLIAAEPTDLSEPAEVVAITEEEWASRARNDAIYDGKQMVFYGPAEGASDAENVRLATKRAVEDRRAREQDVGETEQLFLDDTQTAVDQPGRSAGSVLVVRSDEKDLSAEDREARNAQAENDRVVFQQNSPIGAVAPEGEEKLAGVGVGIQDRAGLDSERPRVGATVAALEGAKEETPAAEDRPSETDIRTDAEEAKAKEIRDDKGASQADSDKGRDQVRQAGIDASQEAAEDRQSDAEGTEASEGDSTPDDTVCATEAAQKLADEHDVDLTQVEATGAEGKITKRDVERHLESQK
jgi:pyruvate/2-oxoglutarate dehydrogenase complex dihydrolipoamide acyltransferase (E2) component